MCNDLKETLEEIMDGFKEPFVSEGDFQFALATELQRRMNGISIIMEYPIDDKYIDIAIVDNDKKEIISFIEVKYKTKEDTFSIKGIKHTFKTAGTNGKLYIKDIMKIESLNLKSLKTSCCIFLTNNSSYWEDSKYSNYKINKKIETNKKEYICNWNDCNFIKNQNNKTKFKYLIVEVK